MRSYGAIVGKDSIPKDFYKKFNLVYEKFKDEDRSGIMELGMWDLDFQNMLLFMIDNTIMPFHLLTLKEKFKSEEYEMLVDLSLHPLFFYINKFYNKKDRSGLKDITIEDFVNKNIIGDYNISKFFDVVDRNNIALYLGKVATEYADSYDLDYMETLYDIFLYSVLDVGEK